MRPITLHRPAASRAARAARAALAALLVLAGAAIPGPSAATEASPRPLVMFDVPGGSFYAPAVEWMRHTGLTTGVGGRAEFLPRSVVSRAELATFLWRVEGSPPAPPSGFRDVPEGTYFATAVGWLRAEGLTTGVGGSDRFEPHTGMTRAELATFLWRWQGRPDTPPPAIPGFRFEARVIDGALAHRMSSSWRPGCPVPLEDLRYLTIRHWGFGGRPVDGEMVVHRDAVEAVRSIFAWAYGSRFPVERMRLVDDYGGDDHRSMAANNTSAFNCRQATGGGGWSEHAFGRAVDVNPVQNPYVSGGTVLPPAGAAHLDRSRPDLGLIQEGGPVVAAADAVGWGWGGRWQTVKDYQHLSAG